VRVESDLGPDPIKARIAEAEKAKVHTMLLVGGRDMDAGAVSVRSITAARKVRSPRRKWSRIFWRASKSGGSETQRFNFSRAGMRRIVSA
jgi:histidyl-tRNA synthetase